MVNFKLINPYIDGSLKTVFSADNAKNAAEQVWESLSGHVLNNVPKFAFTLEQTSDGSLHNFIVQERSKDKKVKYCINELDCDVSAKTKKAFKKNLENFKNKKTQYGGKKRYDDDEDLDDDDDDDDEVYEELFYKNLFRRRYPINFVWYDPRMYKLDYVVSPTWVNPNQRYIPPTVIEVKDIYVY